MPITGYATNFVDQTDADQQVEILALKAESEFRRLDSGDKLNLGAALHAAARLGAAAEATRLEAYIVVYRDELRKLEAELRTKLHPTVRGFKRGQLDAYTRALRDSTFWQRGQNRMKTAARYNLRLGDSDRTSLAEMVENAENVA